MAITLHHEGPRNRLNTLLGGLTRLPRACQLPLFNFLFGRYSRFYRTAGIKAASIAPHHVTLTLADRGKLRNHVRGIHAVAVALPAEYAAGLVVAQHLPPHVVVVLRQFQMDLRKPVRGAVRATATLSAEQAQSLRHLGKGDIEVAVRIEDQSGQVPVTGSMRMAWLPRK